MKAMLSFSLPEEKGEFNDANLGWNWRGAVREIVEKLAEWVDRDTAIPIEDIKSHVWLILNERGLDPYED